MVLGVFEGSGEDLKRKGKVLNIKCSRALQIRDHSDVEGLTGQQHSLCASEFQEF
jgi:hypothetical protein